MPQACAPETLPQKLACAQRTLPQACAPMNIAPYINPVQSMPQKGRSDIKAGAPSRVIYKTPHGTEYTPRMLLPSQSADESHIAKGKLEGTPESGSGARTLPSVASGRVHAAGEYTAVAEEVVNGEDQFKFIEKKGAKAILTPKEKVMLTQQEHNEGAKSEEGIQKRKSMITDYFSSIKRGGATDQEEEGRGSIKKRIHRLTRGQKKGVLKKKKGLSTEGQWGEEERFRMETRLRLGRGGSASVDQNMGSSTVSSIARRRLRGNDGDPGLSVVNRGSAGVRRTPCRASLVGGSAVWRARKERTGFSHRGLVPHGWTLTVIASRSTAAGTPSISA